MENAFIIAEISLELGVRELSYKGLILLRKMTRSEANLRYTSLYDVRDVLRNEKPKYGTTTEQQIAEMKRWLPEVRRQVGEGILNQEYGSAAGRKKVQAVEEGIKYLENLKALTI